MFFALAYAFTTVGAAPVVQSSEVLARDIFSPPILYPNAATVWFAGQSHNVRMFVISLSTVIHGLFSGYLVGSEAYGEHARSYTP